MLLKIQVCSVDSTAKLKRKITVANDLDSTDFLKAVKLDEESYLYLKNLKEVLVTSGSYSHDYNFDLGCLEQVIVSELKESFKG